MATCVYLPTLGLNLASQARRLEHLPLFHLDGTVYAHKTNGNAFLAWHFFQLLGFILLIIPHNSLIMGS